MAVPPFASIRFGSTITRSDAISEGDFSLTRNGCSSGGWSFIAKRIPPRYWSEE